MKTIAFFGHRHIKDRAIIKSRIIEELKEKIKRGYLKVLVGVHGEFDDIVLDTVIEYKKTIDTELQIIIVLTSFALLKKDEFGYSPIWYYVQNGCETMMYNIEEEYYKNQIVVSNKMMVDESDLVICYVDMGRRISGAKRAVRYAIKQGKEVINLF